jgi:uncharacterized protein (UPF0332 family)
MRFNNVDSEIKTYLDKAEKKLLLAKSSYSLSTESYLRELCGLPTHLTFFDEAVQQAYYSIFYSAKAYFASDGKETSYPNEHSNIQTKLEGEFMCNKVEPGRATMLIEIYTREKKQRVRSTYRPEYDLNKRDAIKSIKNAELFISEIRSLLKEGGSSIPLEKKA